MHPEDPFGFIQILSRTGMKSLERNEKLVDLANQIRDDPSHGACLIEGRPQDCDPQFRQDFENLMQQFGNLAWGEARFIEGSRDMIRLLIELGDVSQQESSPGSDKRDELEKEFISRFPEDQRVMAREMIDLGRASYRLRDDDNIYLGKIEGLMIAAIEEGKARLKMRIQTDVSHLTGREVITRLKNPGFVQDISYPERAAEPEPEKIRLRARQIVGQPAGPGVATGKARVVQNPADLFTFKKGEILICDSVDPGMTFVVPLAAGIVERRGGMLIHGAIIAREYGIPCVTGAPGAAEWIKTGDRVTVDGFLGIVINDGSQ
jgi:pyruvate,water dikinase